MKALTCAQHQNASIANSQDRRRAPDGRIGRRQTDAWFPYSTAFVTQALAQAEPLQLGQSPAIGSGYKDEQASRPRLAVEA